MNWETRKGVLSKEFVRGVLETGIFQQGDFILASGERSDYYFDLRLAFGNPRVFSSFANALLEMIREEVLGVHPIDGVAGIPTAGLPYATFLSLELGLPLFYPREKAKDHGTMRRVEGGDVRGKHILLVDDLITSATSKIGAIEALEHEGASIRHLCILLDREQGGSRMLLDKYEMQVHSLCKISEILPYLVRKEA